MIPCAAGKAALRPSAWVTETWHSVRTAAKDLPTAQGVHAVAAEEAQGLLRRAHSRRCLWHQ